MSKALYIVRATPRNLSGAEVNFEVADGADVYGRPTFSGTQRQVPPGRSVLAIPAGRTDLKIGIYRVAAGNQMKASDRPLTPGEVVAITCVPDGPEGVPEISGSLWTVVEDGTVVLAATSSLHSLQRSVSILAERLPDPPAPLPEPELAEPVEVDETLQPEG